MLKIIRVITAFILVLILGFVIYKFNVFRFIETREYTTNFSQFVSLKSLDEYVVAELRTNESFHRESEKILWQGIPLGRAVADISLIAGIFGSKIMHYQAVKKCRQSGGTYEPEKLECVIPNRKMSETIK